MGMGILKFKYVIDDLYQAAQEMIDYILKSHTSLKEKNKHIAELSCIMQEMEDKYDKPLLAWWSVLYRSYRQHNQQYYLTPTIDHQILILHVMTDFLKKFSHDSSKSNLILIDILLKKLKAYEKLENDQRFSLIDSKVKKKVFLGIKLALRNAFIYQAKNSLASYHSSKPMKLKIVRLQFISKTKA